MHGWEVSIVIKGRTGIASHAKSDNPVWDASRLIFQILSRVTWRLPLLAAHLAKLWHDRAQEILKKQLSDPRLITNISIT